MPRLTFHYRRYCPRRGRLRRRSTAAGILLVLASGLGIHWYDVNRLPPLPREAPPSAQTLGRSSMSGGPNAVYFYAAAADALTQEALVSGSGSGLLPHSPLARQQAIVAANAEALRLLRMGFTYRYQGQATRWMKSAPPPSLSGPAPNYVLRRQLARLLAADARVKASAGDKGAAIQSCLDAIRFGQDTGHDGSDGLLGTMHGQIWIGIGLEAAAREPGLVSALSAAEARAAARRLEALLEEAPTAAEAFRAEQEFSNYVLHEALLSPGIAKEFIKGRPFLLALLRYGKRGMLDNHNGYMDAFVQRASLPYPIARMTAPPPIPPDPLCQISIPNLEKAMFPFAQKQMQARILLTQLALLAYRREHAGVSPATLSALTGGAKPYLTRVPQDPFSLNGASPLQYRKGKVYSVGSSSTAPGPRPGSGYKRQPGAVKL